jgi:hypothetical protein
MSPPWPLPSPETIPKIQGKIQGYLIEEQLFLQNKVSINGDSYTLSQISIPRMQLLLTSYVEHLASLKGDGILGLGRS